MTGLIVVPATEFAHTIDPLSIDEHTTGFSVRVDSGPLVQATLIGDRWQLSFTGRDSDDTCLLDVPENEARMAAQMLAQRLVDIEPYKRSYDLQRKALSVWLKALAQCPRSAAGDELEGTDA